LNVYETFVDGAKEGFTLIVRLIPYFVAMIVAIGMFRASGGFELLGVWLAPALSWLGIPAEVLPLALVRPFSGQASNAVLVDIANTHGGDSLIAKMAATMMGSTETTFYVVAVYFGAVGIARTRHAIPVGLIADLVGVIAAVWICRWMLG
jgi:spore maturation protein B